MFQCRLCQEKDFRIQDLKEQILDLRSLSFPKLGAAHSTLTVLEADAILSGSEEMIPVVNDAEAEEIERERDRILSGNY